MSTFKKFACAFTLFICGSTLVTIGLSITLSPAAFYASNGIELGNSASLINELRAPAGMLIAAGSIILFSLRFSSLRPYAWLVSALVFLPYGVARLIGFGIDGMPHESIVLAAVIEIAFGIVSLNMLIRTPVMPNIEPKQSSQQLFSQPLWRNP